MIEKLKTPLFYITLFLFISVISAYYGYADYDIFARLLQGKAFWSLGNILHHDIFSYTPTHTWFDHEWGASVIFYAFFAKFGSMGLFWLKVFLIFGIFFFIIEALKVRGLKYSTTPYNFLFYIMAGLAAAQAGFSYVIRCQLLTYLFFAIWLYLLERIRVKREYYWLFSFVPMMLFWANIHGGCASGFGLLVLYTIGEAINKKPFKYYIFTLLACIAIVFVNPWGAGYVKFLTMATTMPRILIAEWHSTFGSFNAGNYVAFKCFFFIILFVVLTRLFMKRKTLLNLDYTKAVVLLAMTYLAVRYTRHHPFFVLSSVVFLYDDFYLLLEKFVKKLVPFDIKTAKLTNLKNFFIYSLALILTIGYFVICKPKINVNNGFLPIKPIEFIRKNHITGNLLVNFQYGSYAAYKLYPANLIAMDGRYEEVYDDYMLPLLNNFFMQAGENPNMLIEKFRPDIIVVEHNFKADKALESNKTYKKVYDDEFYSVFTDTALAREDFEQPTDDAQYYIDTLFDSRLKFIKAKKQN